MLIPVVGVRDARDAHIVMEAVRYFYASLSLSFNVLILTQVRLHVLPLIRRRLVAHERDGISAGNVFVWEEAEDDGGLLRWTDGRRW